MPPPPPSTSLFFLPLYFIGARRQRENEGEGDNCTSRIFYIYEKGQAVAQTKKKGFSPRGFPLPPVGVRPEVRRQSWGAGEHGVR